MSMSRLSTTMERKDCAIPDTYPSTSEGKPFLNNVLLVDCMLRGNIYVKTRVFKDNFGK